MTKPELVKRLVELLMPHEMIGGDLMDEIHQLLDSELSEEEGKGTLRVERLENGYPAKVTLENSA